MRQLGRRHSGRRQRLRLPDASQTVPAPPTASLIIVNREQHLSKGAGVGAGAEGGGAGAGGGGR